MYNYYSMFKILYAYIYLYIVQHNECEVPML